MRHLLACLPLLLLLAGGCRPTANWSPDSKHLALDPRGLLLTYNLETKQFRQLTQGPERLLAPTWAPDGSRLFSYRASFKNGKIIAMDVAATDLATGMTAPIVPDIKPPLEAKPEGPNLNIIAGGDQNALDLMREILALAPSPDGKRILYSVFDKDKATLWIARPDGSDARRLVSGAGNAFHASWSPDGSRVAFYRSDETEAAVGDAGGNKAAVEVVNADGTGLRRLWETAGEDGTLATLGPPPQWSPDGRSLRVLVDMAKKPGEVFPEHSEVWQVPLEGGKPARYSTLRAPSPFLTLGPGGAAFFFTPKNENEQDPMLGFATADLKSTREIVRLTAATFGAEKGAEVETMPVPSISPDGSRIALAYLPKGTKPILLLHGTAPGSKLEKIDLPLPIVGEKPPAPKPAAKPAAKPAPKPAPRKPAPKKR